MRVGRQENYIPNTEQDENRPTVGNILLTNDLFNIYVNMDDAVLGGDQAGAEALGHAGLKGHEGAVSFD